MKIGLDIDDTITNSTEVILEYMKEYFKVEDAVPILASADNIEITNFYKQKLPEMILKYKVKDNVQEVIDRLRSQGHEIIIITTRGYSFGTIEEATTKYLKENKVNYDQIFYRQKYKEEVCKKQNIDIMVDDSINVLDRVADIGIKTLLFTSLQNQKIKTNFNRVSNWLELEKYINSIK